MTATLPNILPAPNRESCRDDETIHGRHTKSFAPFDQVMTHTLSSKKNHAPKMELNPPVKTDSAILEKHRTEQGTESLPSPKDTSSDQKTPEKKHEKKSAEKSGDAINLSAAQAVVVAVSLASLPAAIPKVQKISAVKSAIDDSSLADPKGLKILVGAEIGKATQEGEVKIKNAVKTLAPQDFDPIESKPAAAPEKNSPALPLSKLAVETETAKSSTSEGTVPLPKLAAAAPVDLATKAVSSAKPNVDGTSVAQPMAGMNPVGKYSKIAVTDGKILPSAGVPAAREHNLPTSEKISVAAGSRSDQATVSMVDASSSSTPTVKDLPAVAVASAADLRSRDVERAQDLIALHATRLSDVSAHSLQVVIKPGVGTELSLELRQRGDDIEAQAVLQRGDFGHLNQQWPQLQQQLEQRGIRLAPLVADGNFANGGGQSSFQQQTPNQFVEPNAGSAEMYASGATTPSSNGSLTSTINRPATQIGWETWA